MSTETAIVKLKPNREKALEQGHPWLFAGSIAEAIPCPGTALASVLSARGKALGIGLYSPGSQIPVRMLRRGAEVDATAIDRAFFRHRLEQALALRRAFVPPETTGYRVLNAEGDGLPGWTIDRYGDVLVSQLTVPALERLRDDLYGALGELMPGMPILQSNQTTARRREGLGQKDETIAGTVGATSEFLESGLRFVAELRGGQKTGFYCDQRPNRRRAEQLAAGRRVLDLFAHTGAFSAYALRGGAASVVAIESSERLIERGREQIAANALPGERVEWVQADAFQAVRHRGDVFDLIVCDPPPLAKRKSDLDAGARAYKDLNRHALKRLAPGGLLMTFSCSAAIEPRLFRQILFSAAVEAERRVALLEPLGPGADHPVSINHPEGEYLKGWLMVAIGDDAG